jgi:hypothetical protein
MIKKRYKMAAIQVGCEAPDTLPLRNGSDKIAAPGLVASYETGSRKELRIILVNVIY